MRFHAFARAARVAAVAIAFVVAPLASLSAQGPCASSITFNGTPRIGTTISMTISGSSQCHSCLWISKNPGPTQVGSVTIPIGVPLLNALDYGQLPPSGSITLPIIIPNDPNIIGLQLFMTNVSFPSNQGPTLSNVEFSPAAVLTFVR